MKKRLITILSAVFLIGLSLSVLAQSNPVQKEVSPAQAKFNEGELARQNKDLEKAVSLYQQAFEIDPEYLAAHSAFINNKRALMQNQAEADKKKGIVTTEDVYSKANIELRDFY